MINAIQIKQKSIYSSISSIRVEFFHDFWKISNKMIYFWSIFGHFGPKLVKKWQNWPKMAKNGPFWASFYEKSYILVFHHQVGDILGIFRSKVYIFGQQMQPNRIFYLIPNNLQKGRHFWWKMAFLTIFAQKVVIFDQNMSIFWLKNGDFGS